MASQNMPAAEVDVTAVLVASLLDEQHPDLASLPLSPLAHGWDNVMFRLGDELTVRLPRREMAARLIDHEHAVLPAMAARLPIAVPAAVRAGRPSRALGYPWAWSVTPWIPGEMAATVPFADSTREAQRLGEFLAALHVTAPDDAPPNPYRGHFVGDNTAIFTDRVGRLGGSGLVDADVASGRWHELVAVAPWSHPDVWIHGDLHGANLLVDDGELSGVIDFGDVCAGDPATDLSVAWSLFDASDREVFRAAAGSGERSVDDATWQRAEAWALHFAVVYLLHSADNPLMGGIGRRLARVLLG